MHIPFKGGAEAMSEVMAGRIDFFGPGGIVLPNVRGDKLAALVVNGAKRAAALPDVPTTTSEAGFANAEYPISFGLFLPAKTSRAVVDKLHDESSKHCKVPKVREWLAIHTWPRSDGHDAARIRRVCPKGNRCQRSPG